MEATTILTRRESAVTKAEDADEKEHRPRDEQYEVEQLIEGIHVLTFAGLVGARVEPITRWEPRVRVQPVRTMVATRDAATIFASVFMILPWYGDGPDHI